MTLSIGQTPPQESGIVLQWLAPLRWLAVAGQTMATAIAVLLLDLKLPLLQIYAVIAITALSNIILQFWRIRRVPAWLVPAVLLLDVLLLTALLLCTGGASNPFTALYLVHVAMAVATLTEGRSWLIVAASAACYGLLIIWRPFGTVPLALSPMVEDISRWVALALVSILIAYFVGRMTRSLRRHEQELIDARERAGRNEQLAALTTLAAGAAHELNTPLSTIAVVARELEVLSRNLTLDDSLASDARLIRQEVDRCQFILSRMRVDVLQGEAPKSSPMAAAELVAILSDDLKPIAGDSLKIECDRNLREISLPLRAVQQAVNILVDNALDASPPGKVVTLSIGSRDGRVVFEVRDQGSGMSADVIRRAGEPFFTTKPPGEGMGLGLFLARLVAEKLGGSLKLDSQPGRGTRAILELPGAAV
jgi:two-component system sensor histidine kinase RegB